MTDLTQHLYDYLEEHINDYMPHRYFWHESRVRELREEALLKTLTEDQRELWEDLQSAEGACADLREQALFHSTLALVRALSVVIPPSF